MHLRRLAVLTAFLLAIGITIVMYPQHRGPGNSAALTHATLPKQPTTTTTIPPGNLPQTRAYPSTRDPIFLAHMRELVAAAANDRPSLALSAFFPLSAYVQVKAIPDPVTDWHVRLIANFGQDIGIVHRELGPDAKAAKFLSISVPNDAIWVKPGVEYNKGSYWRVYNSEVTCRVGRAIRRFKVTSMISWRGEWYVVHLGVIR